MQDPSFSFAKICAQNRKRFTKLMKPRSIAIFNSNDVVTSNGDAHYPFQQNSDLLWLCGIKQEDTMVILFPDNPDASSKEVLVIRRPDEHKEIWEGRMLRPAEASKISGIDKVVFLDQLEAQLQVWMHAADNVYLNTNENDRKSPYYPTRDYRYADRMRQEYPLHHFERSAKLMKQLRAIKTPEEVALVQQAVDITRLAFLRVCRFIRPGVSEHEIHAEILHEFKRNGAEGEAYPSILAAGDRARTLHYTENDQPCLDGELILMDFGARYKGYCADLTRTIPVNGKFTKRQKEVYNACLHLHDYAKSILKPGISIIDYTQKVGDEATKQFVKIGLLTASEVKNEDRSNENSRPYRKYLYHGISHHLGIDVHDLGTRTEPIVPGMLFTIEPGIYIAEEKMGIRLENNVWITRSGNKDLFGKIPNKADEVEACMKSK